MCDKSFKGGRIIDNWLITDKLITWPIFDKLKSDDLQIENLSFSKKLTNYKLLTYKWQTCHFLKIVHLKNFNYFLFRKFAP